MPLTIEEVIADGGAVAAFVAKVKAAAAKLPAAGQPVSAKAVADLVAGLLPDLGALVDQVRADIAS